VKVSRASKRRAANRKDQVMRQVHETCRNYRWWLFQETEPADGYVTDNYSYWVQAYPQPAQPSTRKPKHKQLSRRALRARLYRYNVPKAQWPELLSQYAGRGLISMPGAPSLKEKWGYSIAKAVGCHVGSMFLVLDEFAYYAPPGLGALARFGRKFNMGTVTVTQELTPEQAAAASGLLDAPEAPSAQPD
jgi:hypothetical protein